MNKQKKVGESIKYWMIKGGDDDGMLFKHSDDVVKYLRDGESKDYNDASDDFIFDEALTHGWVHEHMVPKAIVDEEQDDTDMTNLKTILDSLEPTSELYQSLAKTINDILH